MIKFWLVPFMRRFNAMDQETSREQEIKVDPTLKVKSNFLVNPFNAMITQNWYKYSKKTAAIAIYITPNKKHLPL